MVSKLRSLGEGTGEDGIKVKESGERGRGGIKEKESGGGEPGKRGYQS